MRASFGLLVAASACSNGVSAPVTTSAPVTGASGPTTTHGATPGTVASTTVLTPMVVRTSRGLTMAYVVEEGVSALSIDTAASRAIRWPKVRTPSGALVGDDEPSGTVGEAGRVSASFKIPAPEQGRWTIAWTCGAEPCRPTRIAARAGRVVEVFQSLYPLAPFDVSGDGLRVALDASASRDLDGSLGSVRWAFGDGARAKGPHATHRYDAPGTYLVTCVVIDDAGARELRWAEVTLGTGPTTSSPA